MVIYLCKGMYFSVFLEAGGVTILNNFSVAGGKSEL